MGWWRNAAQSLERTRSTGPSFIWGDGSAPAPSAPGGGTTQPDPWSAPAQQGLPGASALQRTRWIAAAHPLAALTLSVRPRAPARTSGTVGRRTRQSPPAMERTRSTSPGAHPLDRTRDWVPYSLSLSVLSRPRTRAYSRKGRTRHVFRNKLGGGARPHHLTPGGTSRHRNSQTRYLLEQFLLIQCISQIHKH